MFSSRFWEVSRDSWERKGPSWWHQSVSSLFLNQGLRPHTHPQDQELMPNMDSASVENTPPFGFSWQLFYGTMCCWLTNIEHGGITGYPHIILDLSLPPYSCPAHSCSELDHNQSTPSYSMRSKWKWRQLLTWRLLLRMHGTRRQPCEQSHCSESGFS